MLGHLSLMRGDLERARGLCAEGAERLRALDNPAEVTSLLQCGVIAIELGDLEGAHRVAAECQADGRALQASQAASLLFLRGRIAATNGDAALAEGLLNEALRLQRTLPDQQALIVVLIELGHVLLDRHMVGLAPRSFAEAIELAHTAGERMLLARGLEGLARSVANTQTGTAVRLAGAADGLRAALGCTAWPSDRRRLAAWLPIARHTLKASVYRTAWEAGRVASTDQGVAVARGLMSRPTNVPRSRPDPLTRREREVVVLLARALSNQEIAAELTISPATARTHVDHVLAKLGLHSRAQVAVWASQRWLSGMRAPMVQPASARRPRA
jgi:DNA-binding CsgD family transcriptional regulator